MKLKQFLKIDDLIQLINEKGIIIKNYDDTKKILSRNNYYVLMGYKTMFLDENKKYKANTSFNNIYNLYKFDRELKLVLFNALLDIENAIKTTICNQFCGKYGFKENDYLNRGNYNQNHKYIDMLLTKIQRQIKENTKDNEAISHYQNNYNFVPLWIQMKILSFGVIRDMYSCLKDIDRLEVKNTLSNDTSIGTKAFGTYIQLLVDIRNRCGHDEIVFSHIHKRIRIKKSVINNNFKGTGLGYDDILAVLIAIRNILPKYDFNILLNKITIMIDELVKNNDILTKCDLLKEMHLPINYEDLKW